MQYTTGLRRAWPLAAAAVIALTVAACQKDQTTAPKTSVLSGLARVVSNDTVTGTPPAGTTTPGSFHGFVLGHGTGTDTIATAPRLTGAKVTAYPQLGFDGDTPITGDAVGSVTTDASGAFQFPVIAGGPYVVLIEPSASSGYRSEYALTTISNVSNTGTWWVVLSAK